MPTEIDCCCACQRTVPRQWLRIRSLTCLLHSCHMPALTDAMTQSSQDSSQKSQRFVHPCSRIVAHIVNVAVVFFQRQCSRAACATLWWAEKRRFEHAQSWKQKQDEGKMSTSSRRHFTHRQLDSTYAFNGLSHEASCPPRHILRILRERHFHNLLVDPSLHVFTWDQPLHLGLSPKLTYICNLLDGLLLHSFTRTTATASTVSLKI